MVLRVGILDHDGRTSFCIVRNISPLGVQLKLFGRVAQGAEVQLRIGDEEPLRGRAVWVRGQLAGIEFQSALDASTLLRVTQKALATKRRSTPRINATSRLVVRTNGKAFSAELRDISASGARVRTKRPIEPGHTIMLDLPDLPPLKAYARWIEEHELGLAFETPVPIQIIAEWLDGRVVLAD